MVSSEKPADVIKGLMLIPDMSRSMDMRIRGRRI